MKLSTLLIIATVCSCLGLQDAVSAEQTTEIQTVLFNNTSNARQRLAYLIVDSTGTPFVYPSPRRTHRGSVSTFFNISRQDLSSWTSDQPVDDSVSLETVGWNEKQAAWEKFIVSFKFKRNKCTKYKVEFADMRSTWLAIDKLKKEFPVPVEILCVEGPRDLSSCGRQDP